MTWTASATQCTTPEFDIWMLPPGAEWRQVRDWSTAPTFAWNTSGATAGSYVFEVHARSVGASAAYEAYADVAHGLH